MKTFKGTKGEWTISNCSNGGKIVSFGEYKHQILNVHDAKLIASAPELLEALMIITNALKVSTKIDRKYWIKRAEKAINKAL